MTRVLFDADALLYATASIGEKRSVKVVHRASGDEYEFPNRTSFYGRDKKKSGGWLAEYNQGRTSPRLAEEFDYIDVQEPEPIEHCMHSLRNIIERVKNSVGASSYYGYIGRGDSFRLEKSTVIRYKGTRLNSLRPVHLDGLKDYLIKHHYCKIVTGLEADDWVSIDSWAAYDKWKKTGSDDDLVITACIDKDAGQTAAHLLHPFELSEIDSHDGSFGYLRMNDEGKVKGRGRMWLYWQIISGDDADHYCPHAAYDNRTGGLGAKKWGPKTAYKYIADAKNDREAWEGLVKAFQHLYPQPVTLPGWRAYEDQDKLQTLKPDWETHVITVDAMSMLQECATLAFMLRKEGDTINVREICSNLGVKID